MTVLVGEQIHVDRGGRIVDLDGIAVAAGYGDPASEYEAARSRVVLVHRAWRALIDVRGVKHVDFLQGLLSNDVGAVEAEDGCRAALLDTKGHIVADLDLWSTADSIRIGCDARVAAEVIAVFRKYVLGAPVEFDDTREATTVVGVIGPEAEDLLREVGVEPPNDLARAHHGASLGGVDVHVARTPALAGPGVELHLPAPALGEIWETFEAAGAALAGWEVTEILRVEAGMPGHGSELTGAQFPQEAGLEDAVDFEKGCYLGQETVARIHYRGQVNRLLTGMRFSSVVESELSGAPKPDAELVTAERTVGTVTSAVVSPRHGPIGLGYVRREQAGAGTPVDVVVDGQSVGAATVESLPFGS